MIKIIKKGKIPPSGYEITCYHCNSIFQYDRSDLIFEDRPCGDAILTCPVCAKRLIHSEANLLGPLAQQ